MDHGVFLYRRFLGYLYILNKTRTETGFYNDEMIIGRMSGLYGIRKCTPSAGDV